MISGLKSLDYYGKLKELNLQSLETRRIQYDLVQTYKIVHGKDKVDRNQFFSMVDTNRNISTRQNSFYLNIKPKKFHTQLKQNTFATRVIKKWNDLPNEVKELRKISEFKMYLSKNL